MNETNAPSGEQQSSPSVPQSPTEMLHFQCKELQRQNELLTAIDAELKRHSKAMSAQMKALNKHTNSLRNISTAATIWILLVVLGLAIAMCAPLW